MVERTTPKMVRARVILTMIFRGFLKPSHSRAAGSPLDEEGDQIEQDAQAHFEEHRGGAGLHEDGIGQPPGPAHVVMQGEDHQGVAQEGGEDRRPHRGVITLQAEDVAGRRGGVAAGRQGHAAQQVEGDPDAPGVVVRQVGDRAEPLGEAQEGDHRARAG